MAIDRAAQAAIALAIIAIGGPLLLEGAWLLVGLMALLGLVWALGHGGPFLQLINLAFAGTLAAAAFGAAQGIAPGAMLVGTLAALAAWDLTALRERVIRTEHASAVDRLFARHAQLLGIVLAMGGGLGGLAMLGGLSLGLGGALALGLVAILGLQWLLRATARNAN